MHRSIIMMLLGLLWLPAVVQATTYWIHTSGSDGTACSSIDGTSDPGTYRATITGGAGCMASGDTLKLKNGTYTANMWQSPPIPSGTSGAHTIVEGESIAGVIIKPTSTSHTMNFDIGSTAGVDHHITLRKMTIDGINTTSGDCIKLGVTTQNWILNTLEIKNCWADGIYAGDGTFASNHLFENLVVHDVTLGGGNHHGMYIHTQSVTVDRVEIYNSGMLGIQFTSNGGSCHVSPYNCTNNSILRNSYIHDNNLLNASNGRVGVSTSAGTNVQIYNNIISNHRGPGISVAYNNVRNTKIYNNTLYNNMTNGGSQGDIDLINASGIIVQNNVIKRPSTDGTIVLTSSTATLTSNLLTGAPTSIWVSPSTANFALVATSPALNNGTVHATYCKETGGTTCDQGALQSLGTPTGTCSGNSFVINIPNQFPPLSGTSGFTSALVGVDSRTLSAPVIAGNQITHTISGAAITGGQSCTVNYVVGTVKSCQDIGRGVGAACSGAGQRLQSFAAPLTLTNLTGGSVPVYTTGVYRFEFLNSAKGDFIGPESTLLTVPSPAAVRVCMGLRVTVANAPLQDYLIQARLNGGAWADLTDVPTETTYLTTDTTVVNQEATLDNLTLGGSTFISLGYQTAPLTGPPSTQLNSGQQGNKCAVVALKNGLTPGDDIDYRIVPQDGSAVAGTPAAVTIGGLTAIQR